MTSVHHSNPPTTAPAARLASRDRAGLFAAFEAMLPAGAQVYLFGSRADPARRGGDIDLLVHVPGIAADDALALKRALNARLLDTIEDQKIDILVTPSLEDGAPSFVHVALLDAVPLWP